jgi:hypothetical protein
VHFGLHGQLDPEHHVIAGSHDLVAGFDASSGKDAEVEPDLDLGWQNRLSGSGAWETHKPQVHYFQCKGWESGPHASRPSPTFADMSY